MRIFASVLFSILSFSSHAACSPPDNEVTVVCEDCGNLEQNLPRGFDVAWNAFRTQEGMRQEIGLTGTTEVILDRPRFASAGVLWYRVNIVDPTWRISNSTQYSRMVSLMRARSNGFEGSVGAGGGRTGAGASIRWERSITEQISQARIAAISTGSGPFTLIIEDQNGNEIGRKSVERNAGDQTLPVPDQREFEPDQRYEEIDCLDQDERVPPEPVRRRSGDRGTGAIILDRTAISHCSFTNDVRCYGDFSSPHSTGVVCSVDVGRRC